MSGSLEQGIRSSNLAQSFRRFFVHPTTISETKGLGFVPVIPEIHAEEVITKNLARVVSNLDPFLDSLVFQTLEVDKIPEKVEDIELQGYVPAANIDVIKEFFRGGLISGKYSEGGVNILDIEQILQVRAFIRLRRIGWTPELISQLHQGISQRLYVEELNDPVSKKLFRRFPLF